jgi:hypothetical protein
VRVHVMHTLRPGALKAFRAFSWSDLHFPISPEETRLDFHFGGAMKVRCRRRAECAWARHARLRPVGLLKRLLPNSPEANYFGVRMGVQRASGGYPETPLQYRPYTCFSISPEKIDPSRIAVFDG